MSVSVTRYFVAGCFDSNRRHLLSVYRHIISISILCTDLSSSWTVCNSQYSNQMHVVCIQMIKKYRVFLQPYWTPFVGVMLKQLCIHRNHVLWMNLSQDHKCNSWSQWAATEECFQRVRISVWTMCPKLWQLCWRLTIWTVLPWNCKNYGFIWDRKSVV